MLACLATLVISPLESSQAEAQQGLYHLSLSLFDRVGLPDRVLRTMRKEIEGSYANIGVHIQMEIYGPSVPSVPSLKAPTVQVLLWPRDGTLFQVSDKTMGLVLLKAGQAPESAYIFFPAVVRALTQGRRKSVADLTSFELGRALGRVVAHELIHVVAPRHPHSQHGLTQRALTKEFLSSLRPAKLDPIAVKAFIRSLQNRTPLEAEALPTTQALSRQ